MTTDKVMAELRQTGGKVMCSSFDETRENEIRKALEEAQAEIEEALPDDAAATAPR